MNKPKLVRKIIYFDMMQLAELESWYKDMSAEGLHLKKIGNTWATFEKVSQNRCITESWLPRMNL